MAAPKNKKDLSEFLTTIRTQFASAAGIYEGPIKALFEEVSGKLGTVLDGLPKTSDAEWPMSDKLDWLFETLSSANNLVNLLGLEMNKVKTTASAANTLASALAAGTHLSQADHEAGVKTAVDAAIAARTGDNGDLVPKARVDQLCSAAKELGIKEGRGTLQAELDAKATGDKLAADRTAGLTTAGLPLPEAEVSAILRASEDAFNAAKTLAETRLKGLTEAGLELPAELLSACWGSEAEFKKFQKTVTSIPALKKGGTFKAEPFATPPGGGGTSTGRMLG